MKHTPGPWECKEIKGWGDDLCITSEGGEYPIAKMVREKRYYTDFPSRIDSKGNRVITLSTEAARAAGNYIATEEIRKEVRDLEKANAALIAASPKLLAALKGVIEIADRDHTAFTRARAAIAEAEGE